MAPWNGPNYCLLRSLQTWLYEGRSGKHGRLGHVQFQLAEFDGELYDRLEDRVDVVSSLCVAGARLVGQHHGQAAADRQQAAAVRRDDGELCGDAKAQQLREPGRDQGDLVGRCQLQPTTHT